MTCTNEQVQALVHEVVRTGVVFSDLVSDLLEALPEDAYPGEDQALVLLEMLAGSIKPAADAAGPSTVRHATALAGAICDRAIADLEAAAKLAARED